VNKKSDRRAGHPGPGSELANLRLRLAEAEGTLGAIRRGEVDVVVVSEKQGLKLFTLDGAGEAYRTLIESMNEGALTLTADKTIFYANACFARMVKSPLEQVMGGSFRRFLAPSDLIAVRALLHKKMALAGAKLQVQLTAADGTRIPAQISFRPLAERGPDGATLSVVVTDMTAARRGENELRALANRVVQVQEAERSRVSLELHDNITQLLCAIQFRAQSLVASLPARIGPARAEAEKLRDMLGDTVKEVERIAHNLRPSVLDQLGLSAALRETCTEFSARSGLIVTLGCEQLAERLPPDTELALYRILQIALNDVAQHAHARCVKVALTQRDALVELVITDDGLGFDPQSPRNRKTARDGIGRLSMQERTRYVGGVMTVKSNGQRGTELEIRVPMSPGATLGPGRA